MFLQYVNLEGKLCTVSLVGRATVTIGRSPEASIAIPETKISRLHAEIHFWDDDYVVKDLKSRNGTFLNNQRIDVAILNNGDILRVGPVEFQVGIEKGSPKGAGTILREVAHEMEHEQKGYRTVLREIVRTVDRPRPKPRSG